MATLQVICVSVVSQRSGDEVTSSGIQMSLLAFYVNYGVIDRSHVRSDVAQKMLLTVRACSVCLLKLRLCLTSETAHGLNF